jgi:serine/threonine-protein kinase 11
MIASEILAKTQTSKHQKMVNQYLFLKKLGQGSSSKVYLAKDTLTNKYFALKVIQFGQKSKSSFIQQVIHEIRIMTQINHQNIIKLKEILFSEENNRIYIVMEYASCGSLDQILKIEGKISEKNSSIIFKQIIKGLAYLHQKRIVHHDIKPSNIVLTKGGIAKISDFGVSFSFESADNLFGSPAYQAPEIVDDDDDENNEFDFSKTDVWSLGVSLFESVFGFLPFEGDDIFQIVSAAHRNPVSIPFEGSDELKDILQKMLSVNPEKRISLLELLDHSFFNCSDDFNFDSINQLFIPEKEVMKEIEHSSATTWTINDFPLMKLSILSSLPCGFARIGFNNENSIRMIN